MPSTYSSQYRMIVLAQVCAGRSVYGLADDPEVSAATILKWRKHDQIEVGAVAGLSSQLSAELRAARARRRRISEPSSSAGSWWGCS